MAAPDDGAQFGLYLQGMDIQNSYDIEPGVCILPLAESPPESQGELETWSPVVVLRLHAPYRVRRVSYTAKKENNPPVMPTPDDVGKFVFVNGTMSFETGLNMTFRNFDWSVQGDYTFVENCVSRPQDGFVLGSPPWTWQSSQENADQFGGVPAPPTIGAISDAGPDAQLGNFQASQIFAGVGIGIGASILGWGYNTASYYPGGFMNSEIINAGPSLRSH